MEGHGGQCPSARLLLVCSLAPRLLLLLRCRFRSIVTTGFKVVLCWFPECGTLPPKQERRVRCSCRADEPTSRRADELAPRP